MTFNCIISIGTTNPGPCDTRQVMYRGENLMTEVYMEQWKVNKAYGEC